MSGTSGADNVDFDYSTDGRSKIYWDNGLIGYSNYYYLCTTFRNSTALQRNFSDNDMYEFLLEAQVTTEHPSIICNRSITSFILINIPNNSTLNAIDSDNDRLKDWEELFQTYTNPFLADTDNDGINDKNEVDNSTDPNDYTD